MFSSSIHNRGRLLPLVLVAVIATSILVPTGAASAAPVPGQAPARIATVTTVPFTTAPKPVITGTAVVGSALSVSRRTWSPTPSKFTYQWKRNGVSIPLATATSYAVVDADAGATITVTVRATRSGYTATSRTSSATAAVTRPLTSTSVPTITGTLAVGSTLTATATAWEPAPVAIAWQWLRGTSAITGATSSTYELAPADLGKTISVRATGTRTGYASQRVSSAATSAILAGTLTQTPVPTVTGAATVGATLTAAPGTWLPVPVTLSYQWMRGAAPIAGATSATYVAVAADLGARLSVVVSGARAGFTSASTQSDTTSPVLAAEFTTTPVPVLTGTAVVGRTLTAAPGTWAAVPGAFEYEWLRDDVPIAGAPVTATYLVTNADFGSSLSVTVTATRPGYQSVSRTSEPTDPVVRALGLTPVPTISGTARVAETLTATAGTWGPAPVELSYQWRSNGDDIESATEPTYTVGPDDAGAKITVAVTGDRDGYESTTVVSAPTATVAAATLTLSPVPTLSGSTVVGSVLTATPGTWGPTPVTLAYVWKRGTTTITGATAATYTLVGADLGAKITVTVTGSRPGYTAISRTSIPSGTVTAGTLTSTPAPVLDGDARVGETLSVLIDPWGPAPVSLAYRWLRDGVTITGATASTYVVTAADLGAELSVAVTGTKVGYVPVSATSDSTTPVVASTFSASPTPTITGSPVVGGTLTAVAGAWTPAPALFGYQWRRDGVAIAGAPNAASYVVTPADAGAELSVAVTATRPGYATVTRASAATGAVLDVFTSIPRPVLTGTTAVGSTLTATPGTWAPGPVTLTYSWKRGTTEIGGADASTYTLVPADAGRAITVTVTGTRTGFATATSTSLPTATIAAAALTATPTPTITGTAVVGSELTAVAGTWTPAPVTLSYQWLRGGVVIAGATSSTYTLAAADVASAVAVTVTGARDGFVSVSRTSAATAAVAAAELAASPVPTITGTASVGSTLTAVAGSWQPTPVSLSYQWRRGGAAIAGATASTYVVVGADVGTVLTVTVTGTKDGYTATSRTSAATASVLGSAFTASPVPTITGTVAAGSTLTAVAGSWTPAVVALAYQWKRGETVIAGATLSTYQVAIADVGSTLTVSVTGTKTGYETVTRTSAATITVPDAALTSSPTPTISGTARSGSTLTATPGSWAPSPVALAYQWRRDGAPISGATASTRLLTSADIGAAITVTVTGTKTGYASASLTSAATAAVLGTAFTTAPTPVISGTAAVGETLSADASGWLPDADSVTLQWRRDGVAIDGETAAEYTLVPGDLGKVITVAATGMLAGYETTTRVSASVTVGAGTLQVDTDPSISAEPTVGSELTADPGVWTPDSAAFAYAWKRNGTAITGATASTYTVAAADVGTTLTVTVTGSATGYTTRAATAPGVTGVAGTFGSAEYTISGIGLPNEVLTATGAPSPTPTTITYQWTIDGEDVIGAIDSTFTVPEDFAGVITVVVTMSRAGYTTFVSEPVMSIGMG